MANRVHARPGWRMARQLTGDLFALGWVAGWALAGRALAHAVAAIAQPARASARAAREMSSQMQQAQQKVAGVPAVGTSLSEPFGGLAGGLQQLVIQADEQVAGITRLATISGWLCFLVPTAGLLVWWLPRRVRFYRAATAAQTFIDSDADLRLFALRAMGHEPLDRLARISSDPVADWQAGNAEVIRALAALELRRTGLGMPEPVRRGVVGR